MHEAIMTYMTSEADTTTSTNFRSAGLSRHDLFVTCSLNHVAVSLVAFQSTSSFGSLQLSWPSTGTYNVAAARAM